MATPRKGRLAGALAALCALAAGEFLAAVGGISSPVVAVGDLVIDLTPGPVIRQTIALLGTAQKPLLLTGIVTTVAILGWVVGRQPNSHLAITSFLAAGALGGLATARTGAYFGGPLVGLTTAAVGIFALRRGIRTLEPGVGDASEDPRITTATRRGFLGYAAGMTAAAGSLAAGSRLLVDRRDDELRSLVTLPARRRSVPTGRKRPSLTTTTEGPFRNPDGLTQWITPNDRFYRIDTALSIPRVDPKSWTLAIDGLVDRPLLFTLDDLLSMELVDAAITLSCVSNEIGGPLVGNAVWTGVPLSELLETAGIGTTAEQVMSRSVDGFTAGFPLRVLDDNRTALVAVGMNGEPLPFRHGFPARLVVAGIYGYVSAVKWLENISLTTMAEDGYWIPRGWAKEAPIKIASRIDVPLRSQLPAGRHAVAGVAWAPVTGVAAVELQVDDGPWLECRLRQEEAPGQEGDSWVQWFTDWEAEPGRRILRVRAYDLEGRVQSEGPKSIAPDGAEGWHTRRVLIV